MLLYAGSGQRIHSAGNLLRRWLPVLLLLALPLLATAAKPVLDESLKPFPPKLDSYQDAHLTSLWDILVNRVRKEPFNLLATVLFLGAITHTFLAHKFRHIAHVLQDRMDQRVRDAEAAGETEGIRRVSAASRLFHFLGEVEAIFGIWVLPLIVLMNVQIGHPEARHYIDHHLNFTEAVFVVVIMAIASTRPILLLAERALGLVANLGGGKPIAWWMSILIVGPLLGSFITEPAAMTICASLLSRKFYVLKPSPKLAYGTLGLLFVAVSIGGTLTQFAAPPVLMVADAWGWSMTHMLFNFGWKAALAIVISVIAYALVFKKDLAKLMVQEESRAAREHKLEAIPLWVTLGHLLFLVFAVWYSHDAPYLLLGLLFFLAFVEVTADFQRDFSLRSPLLVGFFLAGLIIHGGLQQWWIAPVLGRLSEVPLFLGATFLTAFNDNAAITYLATLVPGFSDSLKYAVVAGAVTGGGLTVIANAPNPAGQSILNKHFEDGISAAGLLIGALIPTVIAALCFMLLR
jgi:Na+/H+ antiporter NhaD/arsenite permease-like protein